jgi:hypothetical protein
MTTYTREPPEPRRPTELMDYMELMKRVAVLEAALKPFADCDPDRELREHWTFGADQIRAARNAYYGWE